MLRNWREQPSAGHVRTGRGGTAGSETGTGDSLELSVSRAGSFSVDLAARVVLAMLVAATAPSLFLAGRDALVRLDAAAASAFLVIAIWRGVSSERRII